MINVRTDLAIESRDFYKEQNKSNIDGVTCQFPRPTTNAVSFSFIPARFFKVTPSTFETPSISSPS